MAAHLHQAAVLVALLGGLSAGCGTMGLEAVDMVDWGPVLEIDPTGDIAFARQSPEAPPSTEELILCSAGVTPVSIIDVYLDEYTSEAFYTRDDLPLPIRLAPDEEYPVDLHFAPYAVGQFSGSFLVVLDLEGEETVLTRKVTGAGCDDPNRDGEC